MVNKISIVLPCFNESERLPTTLAEIASFISEHPTLIHEVIVVDDGSTDNGKTIESAMYYVKTLPLRIEQLIDNEGKWSAIRQGIETASTDAILLLDADGSASINELSNIKSLQNVLTNKIAYFGSRFMKGANTENKSLFRRVISRVYRQYVLFWYWFATGRRNIHDMQCPFKLIYKSKIQGRLYEDRFAGDVELACKLDCRIKNIPINFMHMAGSSIKFTTMFAMAHRTLDICTRYRYKGVTSNEEMGTMRSER